MIASGIKRWFHIATSAPIVAKLKPLLAPLIPQKALRDWTDRHDAPQSTAELFGMIYRYKYWGGAEHDFYSGRGSHIPEVIEPFIRAVRAYLSAYAVPPIVLDLGCGDFSVGNRLADLAQHYYACDVVPDLVLRNRRLFARPNLSFHILDGVTGALPAGDVVIVKQVFQHLSNDQIAVIVRKLSQYATWIITEHVAAGEFLPNRNMQSSGYTRLEMKSGIVLTEEPFRVKPKASEILCEVPEEGGLVRTIVYRF